MNEVRSCGMGQFVVQSVWCAHCDRIIEQRDAMHTGEAQ
jgi:hypothetical protein